MKKPGIHLRLMVAAFLLICASTFTLGMVGVQITREFMLKRFTDRISFLAKYLALNSEVGVLIGDKAGLKSLALNLLGEEDVAKVTIVDNHNNQLVDLSRTIAGPLSSVETPVLFKKAGGENLLFRSDRRTPFGTHEIPGADYIGKVRITFSTHGIDQLMVEIARQFTWFSIGLALLAGLVFYIISRSIVVEVTKLADTARQVGQGDLALRARPGSVPETKELALAFNAMLDSLARSREALARADEQVIRQNALAEMGKFSLMIAHEVKNPLSIIKSSLDILKKDLTLPSGETMIAYMEDEIRRLNRLIEDFLSFTRPASPTFRPVDLNGMLGEMAVRFELQHAESPLEIQMRIPSVPCRAQADRDLLTRALSNILKNACEANGEKGVVRVSSCSQDDTWVVEVEDQGEGIPPDNMDKILEPFFTTRSKGTGLGLAFASQVITAHSGNITAKNREEGGALFRVEIPIGRGPHKR